MALLYSVLLLISLASSIYAMPVQQQRYGPPSGTSFGLPGDQAFDYVVVGGGTAGLTIATRLAEDNFASVAVIEAGSFYELSNGNNSQIPIFSVAGSGNALDAAPALVDWHFETTSQAGLNNKSVLYARGKCLGGSSARNLLTYHLGPRSSYDRWAAAVGDDEYRLDSFIEHFHASQGFTPVSRGSRPSNATPSYDQSLGRKGPLSVTFGQYAFAFPSWAQKAMSKLGIRPIAGHTNGDMLGSSYSLLTESASSYERESSETAYLKKIGPGLSGLTIFPSTMATRIVFNDTTATGVEVETSGIPYKLSAHKEVIISAGTFQSPQLLMVSGVGPEATLERYNITVVKHLPGVGQNLEDHAFGGPSFRVNLLTTSTLTQQPLIGQATQEYIDKRTGPLTDTANEFIAFEQLPKDIVQSLPESAQKDLATVPEGWPHVEYLAISAYLGPLDNVLTDDPGDGYNYASIGLSLTAPFSRGNISIASSDMRDAPLINPNLLDHPTDKAVVVAGYRRARQIFENMEEILLGDEAFPGADVETDEQILEVVQNSFAPIYHASCTCRMGNVNDSMAVVDSKTRVFGLQGLRVVDASAFALLPPGHPQATVYALAKKIAWDIRHGS